MVDDAGTTPTALTPEQWRSLDYRPPAREIDAWAKQKPEHRDQDDATQYVAKIGVTYDDCVILMNRAHESVAVPPPARRALAALDLQHQPFGFTAADVRTLERAAELVARSDPTGDRVAEALEADAIRDIARRIAALLPPSDTHGQERMAER
jgi:hypothetical protein